MIGKRDDDVDRPPVLSLRTPNWGGHERRARRPNPSVRRVPRVWLPEDRNRWEAHHGGDNLYYAPELVFY